MTNLEIILEFIAPIEKTINIIFIGDSHIPEFKKELNKHILEIRQNLITPFKKKPKILEFNLTQTFKGTHVEHITPTSIIILDPIISKQTIQTIIHDPDIDPMEAMLIDRFIINPSPNAQKFILDIAFTPDNKIHDLIEFMDKQLYPPNHLCIGDYFAMWFNFNPDIY